MSAVAKRAKQWSCACCAIYGVKFEQRPISKDLTCTYEGCEEGLCDAYCYQRLPESSRLGKLAKNEAGKFVYTCDMHSKTCPNCNENLFSIIELWCHRCNLEGCSKCIPTLFDGPTCTVCSKKCNNCDRHGVYKCAVEQCEILACSKDCILKSNPKAGFWTSRAKSEKFYCGYHKHECRYPDDRITRKCDICLEHKLYSNVKLCGKEGCGKYVCPTCFFKDLCTTCNDLSIKKSLLTSAFDAAIYALGKSDDEAVEFLKNRKKIRIENL